MSTNYDKIYREQRHALGAPEKAFVEFFEQLSSPARVLDAGCGQGRDALFIARLGHHVTGIDWSDAGISQLLEDADREGLNIEASVANIIAYEPNALFDVILFDRTLHMLLPADRMNVLKRFMQYVDRRGYVLISDEKKNLPAMESLFLADNDRWQMITKSRGLLFFQRTL